MRARAAPAWHNTTRIVIVQDPREHRKTTNTARLVHLALVNSALVPAGGPCAAALGAGAPYLLFPGGAARPIEQLARATTEPIVLVVPDASWRRARRLVGRTPDLRYPPCVHRPAGPASAFRLRRAPHPAHLSTFEAVGARSGTSRARRSSWHSRRGSVFVDRTLWTRGDLHAADVAGGIPHAAFTFRGVRRPP
ncbi:MAG: tRNA-uridine aminocarboxypropyltransferase [Planctomycetota bacterium]